MSPASVGGRGSAGSFARGLFHVVIIERDAGRLSVPELDIQERCSLAWPAIEAGCWLAAELAGQQ